MKNFQTSFQTSFIFNYRPLDRKLYQQKTSDDKSLGLAFDPIGASQGSAPFKLISDSTSEIEKKTIYVCKPSPYFFDSKEKYRQYLANVNELVDRGFDVRFVYQDENGQFSESKIDLNLRFTDKNDNELFLNDSIFLSSPINIDEAKKQLNIVHDSSLFLDDFKIHEHENKKRYEYMYTDSVIDVDFTICKEIEDLKFFFKAENLGPDENFNIFLIKALTTAITDSKPIDLTTFNTIIDHVFNSLHKGDEEIFPNRSLIALEEALFNHRNLRISNPDLFLGDSPNFNEHYEHFINKVKENNPLDIITTHHFGSYPFRSEKFTQSEYEYQLNETCNDFNLTKRIIPLIENLDIIHTPTPLEEKSYKNLIQLWEKFTTLLSQDETLIIEAEIKFKKDELVPISNLHSNSLKDEIIGYSISESDQESKPQIIFFQDPKTGLLYAKANQDCKANILIKNKYLNKNEREYAIINYKKQADTDAQIQKSIPYYPREKIEVVFISSWFPYLLNPNCIQTINPSRPSSQNKQIIIGNAVSTAPVSSNTSGNDIIQKYFAGEILSRNPSHLKPFSTRDKNLLLRPANDTNEDWLIEEDREEKPIDLSLSKKNSQEFEQFVQESKDDLSNHKETTAHFKSAMQAGRKIRLHSIASDDEILAFTIKTPDLSSEIADSQISFSKDESGYYYAQSNQDCVLEYVTRGTELQRYDVQDFVQNKTSLLITFDSDLTTQDNFTKAVNILHNFSSNPKFQQSINPQDIILPTLQNNQTDKYLDELFDNPASCSHRVMAVAHKFQKKGLKNGEDFRIIGTKGDHTEIELRISDDKWVIINLGGSNSPTIEPSDENSLRPAKISQTKSKILPTSDLTPQITTTILSSSNQGCFQKVLECFGLGGGQLTENQNGEEPTGPIPPQLTMPTSPTQPVQVLAPSPSPKPRPQLSQPLIENFSRLSQLTKVETLISEPKTQKDKNPHSIQSIAEDISSSTSSSSLGNSIYLKSSSSNAQEALKCHLLATHRNNCQEYQSSTSTISSTTLNQEVAKTHYLVSSSKDLATTKEVLFDQSQTANDNLELTANTRFTAFLQSARNEPQKSHLLIIDWNEFSDKMKVATNSMFDKSDRRIGNEKIPDNVKIICLDNSKQSNQDPSITSRFDQAFSIEVDESEIKTVTQEISTKTTQRLSDNLAIQISLTPNVNHDFDFAGLPDWKSALMGLVELKGDQILWTKSKFIEELSTISSSDSNQAHHFTFSNINKENQQQLTSFLEQSKALGYIEFQGQQINLPQNFSFEFKEKEFDFARIMADFDGSQTSSSLIEISQPTPSTLLAQTLDPLSTTSLTGAVIQADLVYTQPTQQDISSQNILQLRIAQNYQLHDLAKLPTDQKIYSVNSFSFDKLLTYPTIDEQGKFYQEQGILEKNRGQNLKLFISGDLSKQQYYLLLSKAQELNIKLDLLLAPQIKLPEDVIVDERKSEELKHELPTINISKESDQSLSPKIIITNNIAKSSNDLLAKLEQSYKGQSISIVNIEDLVISDLFPSFDTKIKESPEDPTKYQFQLKQLTSEIDDKLANGDKIIIKGHFNDKLLKMLHQHFLATEKSYENLYFVIEEKEQSVFEKGGTTYKKLDFLPPSQYRLESHELESKNESKKIILPYFQNPDDGAGVFNISSQSQVDYSTHLTQEKIKNGDIFVETISSTQDIKALSDEQIKKNSSDFISGRKQMLTELFKHSSLVKIVGESGVGKSSLLREFAKTAGDSNSPTITTYNELDNLESWAKDKEGDNLKILVIDEYNVDKKMDYTMFRDFNQQQDSTKPREIFYQGKFYQLTDKHKVVFMGNPAEYGNRKEGKLFEDTKVPTLELKDFPPEYIYQEILQKPILEPIISDTSKLPEEIKKSPELVSKFKEICDEEIKKYKAQNSGGVAKNKTELTVRELQEQVLLKLSKYIDKKIDPKSVTQAPISTADFIETSSTKDNIEAIRNALMIRQQQKQGLLPQSIIGTSGLIFEGDSGIGKSVMIEAVLKSQNITRINNGEELMKLPLSAESPSEITPSQHYYYKIPANLSSQEIEQQLIEASKRGVIVVFDEINTRLNEGLEKTINALLTGSHPSSKESDDQPKAGFMIIGSINSAIYAGRSAMSPAIIHRSTYIKGKELKDYTSEDFKIIMQNWAEHLINKNGEGKMNQEEAEILQFKTTNLEKFEQLISNLAETFHKMLNRQKLQSQSPEDFKKISEIPAESLNIRNLKSTFLKSLSQEIEIEKSSQIERGI